jgi:formyltetrahydrofolate deformylase
MMFSVLVLRGWREVNTCPDYVLLLSCPDARGIAHAVTGFVLSLDGTVVDSMQYTDSSTGVFCMRVHFQLASAAQIGTVQEAFRSVAERFAMNWRLVDREGRRRVLVMVSAHDHCLHDLLYRQQKGSLPIDIVGVVSNHRVAKKLVDDHNISFDYLPITAENKTAQEKTLMRILERKRVDLVVLARYMQVLSDEVCAAYSGRMINIHQSFLPGFKGAKPYQQAYDRGVKLIGATAHYVTPDLDEGPIIEQDVARVSHGLTVPQVAEVGREIETRVLARALQYELEHRVLLLGNRTVVFSRY